MANTDPFKQVLRHTGRRAVVLDGGLATELERQGADLSQVRKPKSVKGTEPCTVKYDAMLLQPEPRQCVKGMPVLSGAGRPLERATAGR